MSKLRLLVCLGLFGGLALFFLPQMTAAASTITLTGTVRTPSGAIPSDSDEVHLELNATFSCSGSQVCWFSDRIDEKGNFEVVIGDDDNEVAQGGKYSYRVRPFSPSSEYTSSSSQELFLNEGDKVDLGTLKLTNPVIMGTVQDPTGTVVTDASLEFRSDDWSRHESGSTNELGKFRIGGDFSQGKYMLEVRAHMNSLYADSTYNVEITDSSKTLDMGVVKLSDPLVIGSVLLPDGSALNADPENCWQSPTGCLSAGVSLNNPEKNFNKWSSTGANGKFKFGAIESGSYTLEVTPPFGTAYTSAPKQKIQITSGQVKDLGAIKLTSPQVKGVVYAPDGKTPVANAWVRLHNDNWSVDIGGNSNNEGVYYIGGLSETGTYTLELSSSWDHPEYAAPKEMKMTIADLNGVVSQNVQYALATKTVSGRVTRANGEGVEAEVNAWRGMGGSGANTRSNPDGTFSLKLTGGIWNIHPNVPWQDQGEVNWSYTGKDQIVEFKEDETVETFEANFSVTTTDSEIIGVLLKPDKTPMTGANVDAHNDSGSWFGTPVKEDGSFKLNVAAGVYFLSAWTQDPLITFSEKTVTAVSGQTIDIGEFIGTSKSAKITGIVTSEDNKPLEGVKLNAFMHEGRGWSESTSNADGSFAIAVTVGKWGVNVNQSADNRYVYDGDPIDVVISEENETADIGTKKLVYADVTLTGFVVDSVTQKPVRDFCSWAFARAVQSKSVKGDHTPPREFGGPVDCQTGKFTITMPSKVGSTVALGIHVPPESEYSLEAEVKRPIIADQTVSVNIPLKKNDSKVMGHLVDVSGTPVQNCDFRGEVFFNEDGTQSWKNGRIEKDCTYQVNLLGGKTYRFGYWIEDRSRFMERPPEDETLTIAVNSTTEKNIEVTEADGVIFGKVTDFNGKPLQYVGVGGGNWPEMDEDEDLKNLPDGEREKQQRKKEIHNWTQTGKDGSFRLGLRKGHTYVVNVNFQNNQYPDLVQPDEIRVNLNENEKEANISLSKSAGQMTGKVLIDKVPVEGAWIWCWSQNGGHMGTDTDRDGKYAIGYKQGEWHCGADTFLAGKHYRTEGESIIIINGQTSVEQNFEMTASIFTVPPSVSTSFDPTQATMISLENGTSISIPANALGTDPEKTVTVTAVPTVSLLRDKQTHPFGVGYELTATDSDNTKIVKFNSNVTITFYYSEDQLAEMGVSEESLAASYEEETTSSWKSVEGGTVVNTEGNQVVVSTNHFSKFAMVSSGGGTITSAASKGSNDEAAATTSDGQNIIVTPESGGGPQIAIWSKDGKLVGTWFAYGPELRLGMQVLASDLDGDGDQEVIAVPGAGFPAQVRVFDGAGKVLGQFFAYDQTFKEGVSFAIADVDSDGEKEIVTVPAKNGSANVKVFAMNGTQEASWNAYPAGFTMGALVAVADLDGDGKTEVVTAPADGSAQIRIFNSTGTPVGQFDYHDTLRTGAASLNLVDMDADGVREIVVTPRAGGNEVRVLDPAGKVKTKFYAYAAEFQGGSRLAIGDMDGDGEKEFVALPNSNGSAQVRVFDNDGKVLSQFFAYPPESTRNGVFRATVGDLDGDGSAEIVFGAGKDLGPNIRVFNRNGKVLSQFMALHSLFRGGVNVTTIAK